MKQGIKFDKRESMVRDCKIVRFGTYEVVAEENHLVYATVPVSSIDEFTFYKIYLQLNNVVRYRKSGIKLIDMKLTEIPMELMAHLMTKHNDFSLVYRNKDSKLQEIADELDKTVTSIYTSMGKLRQAGYLINSEDGLCVPNQECRDLMRKTKEKLDKGEHLAYNYLFKFCVEGAKPDKNSSVVTTSSGHTTSGSTGISVTNDSKDTEDGK
jgi:predicted DNA-binding protein YlxM (UPF0122 family)